MINLVCLECQVWLQMLSLLIAFGTEFKDDDDKLVFAGIPNDPQNQQLLQSTLPSEEQKGKVK